MNYFEKLEKCYLIAEIGVNHNDDLNLAYKMIYAAKQAGADAVKFQTFTADSLVSQGTPKVRYQENTTPPEETHYEMIKKLELKRKDHYTLKEYSEKLGLDFISTPYDLESAKFLNELGVKFFKTASADLIDLPLQKLIADIGKPSIVSVGMASLGEVESTVELYRKAQNPNMILLHCVSNYPCADESLNLRVIKTLQRAFKIPVGFSDHSVGADAAVLSIAFGVKIIEKHFTLDKNLPGPDHKTSATPEEFTQLVKSVRRAEKMLGSSVKQCQEEEQQMAQVSRKSIVLAKDVKKGKILSLKDIIMMRPGTGISSKYINDILGFKVKRNLPKGTLLTWNDIL